MVNFFFLPAFLVLFLGLIHNPLKAQVFGVDIGVAGGLDINTILLANPPLPMLKTEKGTYKLTLQPTYYKGTSNFVGDEQDFDGYALAANYSMAISNRWGWYGLISANKYNTDIKFSESLNRQDSLNNVGVNFLTVGGGLFYQVSDQKKFRPAFNIIAGPFLKWIDLSQNVKRVNTASGETTIDFDMEASEVFAGLLIGGQLGWTIGEKFQINPFGFMQVPLTNECRGYDVKSIRAGAVSDTTTGTCDDTPIGHPGEKKIDFSNFQISGGINITYIPWDLSLNITAPFIRFAVEKSTDQDSTIISLSKSFGDFKK